MSDVPDGSNSTLPKGKRQFSVRGLLKAVFASGVVFFVLFRLILPAIEEAKHEHGPRRANCANNLKNIGIAMQNYHDAHKALPAGYMPDAGGKPMQSWRVSIVSYLGKSLYERIYDFN